MINAIKANEKKIGLKRPNNLYSSKIKIKNFHSRSLSYDYNIYLFVGIITRLIEFSENYLEK